MTETGIVILAAGNSSRLGRPKQLLPYRDRTLLTHITTAALAASLTPVVVITGAFRKEIEDSLQGQAIEIVFNPDWEKGMASGIVAGLSKLVSLHPATDAVIVAVCDQPYISAELFRVLVDSHTRTGKGLIACAYSGTIGTPVLFGRQYFSSLSALSGDEGAKKLLKRYPEDIVTIPFPQGDIDIDTQSDYDKVV